MWPWSVGSLVKLVSFFFFQCWLANVADVGLGGVSYVEWPTLFELWAGERFNLELAVSKKSQERAPKFCVGCSSGSGHGNLAVVSIPWIHQEPTG